MELILIILTVLNAVYIVLLQNIKKTASPWMYRIYNISSSLLLDKSYI